MTNTINDATLSLIKSFEGKVLKAYPDPASGGDPWTIGYGHTGRLSLPVVRQGDVITDAQADEYLKNDLNVTGARVSALVKVEINDNQYGALVSFFENVGETTFKNSSVLTYVNAGEFDRVPGRLALYRLGSGKVMPGLVRRRAAEGNLWLKPIDAVEVISEAPEVTVNASSGVTVQADQNGKKPFDYGVIGAGVTFVASASSSIKQVIGNITETFGIHPIYLLLIVGGLFIGWSVYKHFRGDK